MGIAERREREREQRKLDIISAAERVFSLKGYSDATMDDIAQAAELSRGTLYLYFKGKDEVHREIVAIGMNMLFDLIKSEIDGTSTGMAKLEVIWDTCIRFSGEYADYCDAFIHYEAKEVDVNSDEEMERWLGRNKVVGLTIKTMAEGMSDGSVRRDMTPTTLTLLFWTQITGAIQYVRFKKAVIRNILKIQPDEFLEYFRSFVFDQLGPK